MNRIFFTHSAIFRFDPEDDSDSGWGSVPSDESDYVVKGDDLDFGTSLSTFDED